MDGLLQLHTGEAKMAKRFTIRLVGSLKDGGDLRLLDFIAQLDAFSEALKQKERLLSGGSAQHVYYKIVDLSHNSPFSVTIEAAARRNSPVTPGAVVREFVSDLRNIRRKKPPQRADLPMLEAYRDLAAPINRQLQRVEIVEAKNKVVPIDTSFVEQVDKMIGPDSFSFGSISGRLERVNLHNTFRFEIYPTVGPSRVICVPKSADLREKVKRSLDSYVTVFGRLRYKEWDDYPHTIDARDIDMHEPDSELTTLEELRGSSPDATGGMSAEEFVRSIRDANW
jgi:hypothetical protein